VGQVDELEQGVAPAVVGRAGVEAAQALVGRVEDGGEDGVVEGELVVVDLAAGPVARQCRPVTVEDVAGAPRHRKSQGLGEQQVLRAGSVQHARSPSAVVPGGRPAAAGARNLPS
jgi:hypothetical protein